MDVRDELLTIAADVAARSPELPRGGHAVANRYALQAAADLLRFVAEESASRRRRGRRREAPDPGREELATVLEGSVQRLQLLADSLRSDPTPDADARVELVEVAARILAQVALELDPRWVVPIDVGERPSVGRRMAESGRADTSPPGYWVAAIAIACAADDSVADAEHVQEILRVARFDRPRMRVAIERLRQADALDTATRDRAAALIRQAIAAATAPNGSPDPTT